MPTAKALTPERQTIQEPQARTFDSGSPTRVQLQPNRLATLSRSASIKGCELETEQ